MKIKPISDASFHVYGKCIQGYDLSGFARVMKTTPIPADVLYEPSIKELEQLGEAERIAKQFFGGMPIQIGYCNGHNTKLNALEYHRSSEVNIAMSDMVLLLGKQQDMDASYTYDTAQIEAFYVKEGTMLELYATTLHYAPCAYQGFRCIVVLPKGTNMELEEAMAQSCDEETKLLFAKNKWLIAHPQGGLPAHAYVGLIGENSRIEEAEVCKIFHK